MQSPEYPDLLWVPPRSWTQGRAQGPPRFITIHYTAGAEGPGTAMNGALYDQKRTDGTSTHYFCLDGAMRVLTTSMTWVNADQIREGDTLVGLDEFAEPGQRRRLRPAVVTQVARRVAPRRRLALADSRVVVSSRDHRWLVRRANSWRWRTADNINSGDTVCAPLSPWSQPTDPGGMAWLGGILDGEGCFGRANGTLSFSQREGAVLDKARSVLDRAGLPYSVHKRPNDVTVVSLSGRQAMMQVLGQSRPVRFLDRDELWSGQAMGSSRSYSARLPVIAAEDIEDGEVVSITTTTKTFIAEGLASHNCDSDGVVQCVRTVDTAHTALRHGNWWGIHYEQCGTAQTREQWLDPVSRATIRNTARQAARDMQKWKIPLVRIQGRGVRDLNARGVCGHVDWTVGWPEDGGDHTDPGPEYPWDVLFADLDEAIGGAAVGDSQLVVNGMYRLDSISRGADEVPAGGGNDIAGERNWLVASVKELLAKPAGEVDVQALAAALAPILGPALAADVLAGLIPSMTTMVEQAVADVLTKGTDAIQH